MPDQDKRQRHPASEATTTTDRVFAPRGSRKDPPNGSVKPISARQGGAPPRLDVAVDNGAFRIPLRDIVGVRDADRTGRRASDRGRGDTRAAIGRMIEAQEETARRIAQSLHDEASQMLAIVYLELASIARNSSRPTAERIDRVIRHLDSVCEQMRGLSHELHPMVLERNGLLPALHQLARGVSKRSGLEVTVTGETPELAPAIEAAIYRVVQEALANVMRHAQASRVTIRLWESENRIHCSVRDDGIGYRPAETKSEDARATGLGLAGIFERVDALGGECHILSGGRKGMELQLGIPL